MLGSNTCGNCGSTEHFAKDVSAGGGMTPSILPIGFFNHPRYTIVVCGTCGLARWFVPKELLSTVREEFESSGENPTTTQ